MRRIFTKVILLSSLGLVGCATYNQNENTLAGGITGAVVGGFAGNAIAKDSKHGLGIGLGVVTGALIGAVIGHCLDSSDHNTSHPFLANNPLTTTSKWEDPRSHVSYTLTPLSNLYSINGNANCRDFHFSSTRYDKSMDFNDTACLKPDGRWERLARGKVLKQQ